MVFATDTAGTKGVSGEINSEEIDWEAQASTDPTKTLHLTQPLLIQESRSTLSSTIYEYNMPSSEKLNIFLPPSNNINPLNTAINMQNHTIAEYRAQILTWLSPLESRLRHQGIQDSRAQNASEWLLLTKDFRSWCAGNGGSESEMQLCFSMKIQGDLYG